MALACIWIASMTSQQLVAVPFKSLHGNLSVKFLKNPSQPWQSGEAPGPAGSLLQSTPGIGVASCAMAGDTIDFTPPFPRGTAVSCPTVFCHAVAADAGLKRGAQPADVAGKYDCFPSQLQHAGPYWSGSLYPKTSLVVVLLLLSLCRARTDTDQHNSEGGDATGGKRRDIKTQAEKAEERTSAHAPYTTRELKVPMMMQVRV